MTRVSDNQKKNAVFILIFLLGRNQKFRYKENYSIEEYFYFGESEIILFSL